MIEVQQLSKFYANNRAIDQLNFKIEQGEIIGLVGLNGAGKSTILKIMSCHLTPSGGDVVINGHSISEDTYKVRQQIGFLPEKPPLYEEMTAYKYLEFVALLKDVPKSETVQKIEKVAKKTSLTHVLQRPIRELSYGYRQRVGIAQALVHNPAIVILDEPTNGLDPIQIVEMRDLILSLKGEHTVILSSHILSEITKTCDRIIVLNKGKLVVEGSEQKIEESMQHVGSVEITIAPCQDKILVDLNKLEGVSECQISSISEGHLLNIQLERDIRGSIAKYLVENDCEILEIKRIDAGLEDKFLKLLNKN